MFNSAVIDRAYSIGMHQHRGEMEEFTTWLSSLQPPLHHVLEIGMLKGGTASIWHSLSTGKVICIDLPDGSFGGQDFGLDHAACVDRNYNLSVEFPRFIGILGDSHSTDTLSEVVNILSGDLVDLLFIDGDHTYTGVKSDYEMYSTLVRPGGIIAFHDVLDTPLHRHNGCEVDKFWATLPGHKAVMSANGPWGGIGVSFK